MAITMDGIFINGQKALFRPEDIIDGDVSAYAEAVGSAVEEWMEENVTGGEQVTDTTLTLPGVPADAEVTGNKFEELTEDLNNRYALSYAGMTTLSNGTDYDTITTVGSYKCLSVDSARSMTHCPTTWSHYLYVYQPLNNARYVQEIHVNNTTRIMARYYDGTTWTDWKMLAFLSDIPDVDNTLSTAGVPADAKATGEAIEAVSLDIRDTDIVLDGIANRKKIELPVTIATTGKYIVYYTGNTQASSNFDHTDYIDVSMCSAISYLRTKSTSSGNVATGMAFYDSNKQWVAGTVSLKGQASIGYTDLFTVPVPEDAKYARFSVYHDTETYGDFELLGTLKVTRAIDDAVAKTYGLHEVPKNVGVLNCIKRARQMTDIKWTPAVDLDRVNIVTGKTYNGAKTYFQNKFAVGHEYVGLPYSERNYIGIRRSLEQFVTSAVNASSKECTESVYSGDHNIASYFGAVCVTLVSYALHIPQVASTTFNNNPYFTKLYDLYENGEFHDIDDIELCDMLWASGHVALITDIVRDANETVTHIEVSEETKFGAYIKDTSNGDFGGKARRKLWGRADFLNWFQSFALYRYDANLLSAIPYYACKYIPMIDETPFADSPYLPCIPDEGNKSKYSGSSSGNPVTVLIRDTGYDYLKVFKNGVLFDTLTVTGLTTVTVNCTANSEALYEAYLCNVDNDTETATSFSCTWLVTKATTSASIHDNGDGTITVKYKRYLDMSYPYYVIYNNQQTTGLMTAVTEYDKSYTSGMWEYVFTIPAPANITIDSIKILFDFRDYGGGTSADITPTVV